MVKTEYQDLKTLFKEHSKSTDRQIMNLKRQLNREVVSTPDSHHLEPTAPGPKSQEDQEVLPLFHELGCREKRSQVDVDKATTKNSARVQEA